MGLFQNPIDFLSNPASGGVYIGPDMWGGQQENVLLASVFSWLTRVGAGPHFGSRPVGWYQQHQVAAIDALEEWGKRAVAYPSYYRVKGGQFQAYDEPKKRWINLGLTPHQLYGIADRLARGA